MRALRVIWERTRSAGRRGPHLLSQLRRLGLRLCGKGLYFMHMRAKILRLGLCAWSSIQYHDVTAQLDHDYGAFEDNR